MITILEARLRKHLEDRKALELRHQQLVASYREVMTSNQTRHAQISGAILELNSLIEAVKGTNNDSVNGSSNERSASPDAVSIPGDRSGDHLGSPVVHRDLDQPDTATSESNLSNRDSGSGDTVDAGCPDSGSVK